MFPGLESVPAGPILLQCICERLSGLYRRMIGLGLRRPSVVPHLLGAAWAFRARGWWTRPPFLPLPPASYMAWRMETAYGDGEAVPSDEELERYLRWASEMRGRMRGTRPRGR